MNLRVACSWVRGQLLERALHRVVVGPDRVAKEEADWEAAVAEVDGWLDPPSVEAAADDVVDQWLAAGAELADA